MYKGYKAITKEVNGVFVTERIDYQFQGRKLYIKSLMFPSQLEVDLVGKNPNRIEEIWEVWDFNKLSEGVIDYPTLETSFHNIPVLDAFIKDGELFLTLLKDEKSGYPLGEWLDFEEDEVREKREHNKARFDWITTSGLFDKEKEIKKEELSHLCELDILSGFDMEIDGQEYHFSYDREAQMNLQERWQLFQNNLIDEVTMNAYQGDKSVRLEVNRDLFEEVYLAGFRARENKISKLKDTLYPMVDNSKTIDELSQIGW